MRFGKNIAIYAGADLLGRSIGLLTSPLTTRLLTPEQYGAFPLLSAIWGMVALAQYGGMDSAYPFFRAQPGNSERKVIVSASIVATLSVAFICGSFVLLALSWPWLGNYAEVTRLELVLFLLGLAPNALIGWYLYLLRYMHQAAAFARISVLGRVVGAMLSLPVMLMAAQENRLAVMFAAVLGLQLITFPWSLWELARLKAWPYTREFFSPDLARGMFRYGILLVPGAIVYSISIVADRILVGWFGGPQEVAILALALSLGAFVLMLKGWFALVWEPHLVGWLATGKPQAYLPRLQTVLTGLTVIFCFLATLSGVWSDWVITIVYPASYLRAAALIPWLLLAGTCSVLSLVAVTTVMIANSPRFHLPIYTCALLINVGIGVLTIPRLGALGAAFGNLSSELFIVSAWTFVGRFILKNLKLSFNLSILLGAGSALFLLLYHPGMFLPRQPSLERVLLTFIIMLIGAAIIWKYRLIRGWTRTVEAQS